MSNKTIDLDSIRAARREALGAGPTILFGGVEFELPVEMPFAVIEAFGRMQAGDDEKNLEATLAMMDIARALFGDRYQEFMALGPSNNDVTSILEHISDAYGTDAGESQASES